MVKSSGNARLCKKKDEKCEKIILESKNEKKFSMTHSIPNFGTLTDNFRSVTRPQGRNKKVSKNFLKMRTGRPARPRTEKKEKIK